MTEKFVGIELRNVEFENGFFGIRYVDRDCITFYKPEADFSNQNKIFFEACDYLENHDESVVSCDQAKINEVYYLKG